MTDSIERQQRIIRERAAERAALPPSRKSISQKVREKLQAFGVELARRAADRTPLRVEPKHRTSGPRLVVDGAGEWHTAAYQARLCELCKTVVLAGSPPLKHGRFCGACASRGVPNTAKPLAPEQDDGPQHAA